MSFEKLGEFYLGRPYDLTAGKGLEGYLPGNGLLASLGLGMIAAEHAVASLSSLSLK